MQLRLQHSLLALFGAWMTLISADLTLSDIQPITGFSTTCMEGYNRPITGCSLDQFFPTTYATVQSEKAGKDNCTAACHSGLGIVDAYVQQGCAGAKVETTNTSVISHFILGIGPSWLCGTESGISLSDLPLNAAAAPPPLNASPSLVSIPTSITLPGGPLPPAKTIATTSDQGSINSTTTLASPASTTEVYTETSPLKTTATSSTSSPVRSSDGPHISTVSSWSLNETATSKPSQEPEAGASCTTALSSFSHAQSVTGDDSSATTTLLAIQQTFATDPLASTTFYAESSAVTTKASSAATTDNMGQKDQGSLNLVMGIASMLLFFIVL